MRIRRGMLLILLGLSLFPACTGVQLMTSPADPEQVRGTYTVYLYGCHYPADIENAAFLLSQDAKYPFELYTLTSSYKVRSGLQAGEALAEAAAFLRCGMHDVWYTRLRRIPDDSGGILGYEMVPVFRPYDVGIEDPLIITYALRNGTVRVGIQPNQQRDRDTRLSDDHGKGQ